MNSSEAAEDQMKKEKAVRLLVYGEVLYDHFANGDRVLGGAPFNVAWGLQGLGQRPVFISAVGSDAAGKRIGERMKDWGMSTEGLQTNSAYSTGEVFVTVEADEPAYTICHPRAWDFIKDEGFSSDCLIYHGLLSLRDAQSEATLAAICERSSGKRFLDVNLRPPYCSMEIVKKWIQGVDWLKLNLDELETILGSETISFERSAEAIDILRERFGVATVLLTAGKEGAMIRGEYGEAINAPAPKPKKMVDTVGAGDSFAAVVLDGILRGDTAEQMVTRASELAAKVCGMQGATSEKRNFYKG